MSTRDLPSICEAQRELRAGRVTAVELVEHCLNRIHQFDSRLRAWVRVDQTGAREEAERQDRLARQGQWAGALHGIPIGIKDIVDVAGQPTEAGSPLLKGQVAQQDAAAVARLRASGAILLGKTMTTEFACFDPSPTCNPWNPAHTPGGSSSGSAAAVSQQMCMAALGSQTGGSITRPASYCGVSGLKPTFGKIDLTGVVPVSRRLDHLGVIARRINDLAAVFGVLIDEMHETSTLQAATPGPRLHVIEHPFMDAVDAEVGQVTRDALAKLAAAGAILTDLDLPPSFNPVLMMHRCVMAVEGAASHFDTFAQQADQYGPEITSLIEDGLTTMAIDYALALRHQEILRRDLAAVFRAGVVAVTPATPTAAPAGLNSTGDPSFNSPWSYVGQPTVSIPCGLTPQGLPCGLQLIGAVNQEWDLLDTAAWCEQVLAFRGTPPPLMNAGSRDGDQVIARVTSVQ